MLSKFFLILALGNFCSERGDIELRFNMWSDGRIKTKLVCDNPDLRIPVYQRSGE